LHLLLLLHHRVFVVVRTLAAVVDIVVRRIRLVGGVRRRILVGEGVDSILLVLRGDLGEVGMIVEDIGVLRRNLYLTFCLTDWRTVAGIGWSWG
jgi:hypothetical protein